MWKVSWNKQRGTDLGAKSSTSRLEAAHKLYWRKQIRHGEDEDKQIDPRATISCNALQ